MGYLNRLMIATAVAKLPRYTQSKELYCEVYDHLVRYHIPHDLTLGKVIEVQHTLSGIVFTVERKTDRPDPPPDSIKLE